MIRRLLIATLSILVTGGSALYAEDLVTEVRSPGGHYLFRIPGVWRVTSDRFLQQGEDFQIKPVRGVTLRGTLLPPTERFDLAGEVKRDIVSLFRNLQWEGYEDPVAARVGGSEASRTSLVTRGDDGSARHVAVVVTCGERRLHLLFSRVAGEATASAENGFEEFLRGARIPAGAGGGEGAGGRDLVLGDGLGRITVPGDWRVVEGAGRFAAGDPTNRVRVVFAIRPLAGARLADMLGMLLAADLVSGREVEEIDRREEPVNGHPALGVSLKVTGESRETRHRTVLLVDVGGRMLMLTAELPDEGEDVSPVVVRILGSLKIGAMTGGAGGDPVWQVVKVDDSISFEVPGDWIAKRVSGAVYIRIPGGAGRVACFPGDPPPGGEPDPAESARFVDGMLELDGWDVEQIGRRELQISGARALRIDRRLSSDGRKTEISRSLVFRVGDRCHTLSCRRVVAAGDSLDATFERVLGSVKLVAPREGRGEAGGVEGWQELTMVGGAVRFKAPADWEVERAVADRDPGHETVTVSAPVVLAAIVCRTLNVNERPTLDDLLDVQLEVDRQRYELKGEVQKRRGQQHGDATLRAEYAGVVKNSPRSAAPYRFRVFIRLVRDRAVFLQLFDAERSRTKRAELDALFDRIAATLEMTAPEAPPPRSIHGTWVGAGRDAEGRGFDVTMRLKRDNTYTVGVRFHEGETQEFAGRWFKDATILRLMSFDGQQFFYKYRFTRDNLTLSSAVDDGSPPLRMTRQR